MKSLVYKPVWDKPILYGECSD